jgi:hypothetical protein
MDSHPKIDDPRRSKAYLPICIGRDSFLVEQNTEIHNFCELFKIPSRLSGEYDSLLSEECKSLLLGQPDSMMIYTFHHRRFLLFDRIGTPAINAPYSHLVPVNTILDNIISKPFTTIQLSNKAIVGFPVRLADSIISQYSRHHDPSILLLVTLAALRLNILSPHEIAGFLSGSVLIPAPSVSILVKDIFVKLMDELRIVQESAYELYISTTQTQVNIVDFRPLAFALERLHSYLLLRLVSKLKDQPMAVKFAYLHVIADGDTLEPRKTSNH